MSVHVKLPEGTEYHNARLQGLSDQGCVPPRSSGPPSRFHGKTVLRLGSQPYFYLEHPMSRLGTASKVVVNPNVHSSLVP